jgi:hypothetical protein
MIEWFKNEKLGIYFSDVPRVCIRYVLPSSTESERKSIEKYPFMNKKELNVELQDYVKGKTYNFTIPKSYCFDGASIPRIFWRVIGSNTDNRFLIGSLLHDSICENHYYIDNDRAFSSEVFNALLEVSEVNPFKRFLMKNSVDLFQRFCKW